MNQTITKKCLYYWLIEPVSRLEDTSELKPDLEIPIHCSDRVCKLSFFMLHATKYVRLEIPGLSEDKIPEKMLAVIQAVREHSLSVLKLTHDPQTKYFLRPLWSFVEEGKPHKVGLEITVHGDFVFDVERTKSVFTGTFDNRREIRMLIDGMNEGIPLQHRFLSLFHILEDEFKQNHDWDRRKVDKLLEQFEGQYAKLGFKKRLFSQLLDTRDKCAHARIGRKRQPGVSHLNYKEAVQAEKILPLLVSICICVLNERGKGKFSIEDRQAKQDE